MKFAKSVKAAYGLSAMKKMIILESQTAMGQRNHATNIRKIGKQDDKY
jgi:hypothetical protein